MPLRRLLRNRISLALMLALLCVHTAPSGVILCASEMGLKYEFSCSCSSTEVESSCGCCSDCDKAPNDGDGLFTADSDCVCTDHGVQLAGASSAAAPKVDSQTAMKSEPPSVVTVQASSAYPFRIVHYSGAPPPLIHSKSVVLLI